MSDLGLMLGLARCRLYVSGLRSDAGESPRNVCMFDVFVILACVCLYVSELRSDAGASRGMFICFRISVRRQAGPEECLYVYVMCLCLYVFVDMLLYTELCSMSGVA